MRVKGNEMKNRIMAETASLLHECHSTSFSTIDVADRARVTQPLVMYHYPSKYELLKSAYEYMKVTNPAWCDKVDVRERMCKRGMFSEYAREKRRAKKD